MKKLTLTISIVLGISAAYAQKNVQIGNFNVNIVGEKIGSRDYTTMVEEYYLGFRNDSVFFSEVWMDKENGTVTAKCSSADVYVAAKTAIEKDDLGIEQVIGEGYEYFRISLWTHFKNKKEQFVFLEYKDSAKKVKKATEYFKTVYADSKEPLVKLRNWLK